MPGRDGTGPMGSGTITGRGAGLCTGTNAVRYGPGSGSGLGYRHGFGRGFNRNIDIEQASTKTQKELLQDQKSILQNRIDRISKQLENI